MSAGQETLHHPAWWRSRAATRRFVTDLVLDELSHQRRGLLPCPQPWPEELRLDADLGVDSLELLALGTALSEALHLHASGIEDYLLARRSIGDWVDVAQAGLAAYDGELTFRTSGSSGVPKPCTHPLATLLQEARHLASSFPDRRRILHAVPAHHIYGCLFTVLLPAVLGLPDAAVVDVRASSPGWLARGAQPGDLVVGHPVYWQAVSRTVPALPPDVVGVTSTAPCPDAVSEAVEALGIARLVHVYGSSETGGIGARASHREPYRLFPHWRIEDGGDRLVRRLADGGELVVRGQDVLATCGEGAFHVLRRRDQAVQVGGLNVFPARVREVLMKHPAVADAAVRLMRPDEGQRLKAFIVPKDTRGEEQQLRARLATWIEAELQTAERPKALRFGPGLPVSASGKLADWEA